MELELVDDRQTEARTSIEVDLGGIMRAIPGRVLERRIQRVSDREIAAVKAAVESGTPVGSDFSMGKSRGSPATLPRSRSAR